jgi:hypothetical protein
VIGVYCQLSNFSAISLQELVTFQWDEDEVLFDLDHHALWDFYSAYSLKQQSGGRHVMPPRHIILILSQPVLFLLLNAECSFMSQVYTNKLLWIQCHVTGSHNKLLISTTFPHPSYTMLIAYCSKQIKVFLWSADFLF